MLTWGPDTFIPQVFTYATIVMFVLTTVYMGALLRSLNLLLQLKSSLYTGFNASRFLYAFGVNWVKASGGELPVYYLRDYTKFENFVPITIMGILIYIGDILAVSTLPSRKSGLRLLTSWR
jgi:hypothetical protein